MKTKSVKNREKCHQQPETVEISPYLKAVMKGAPPRYLDDEIEAVKLANQFGWTPEPKDWSPAIKPGSRMEYLWNHPEEGQRLLQEHGVDPDEFEKILWSGKGVLPGFGKKNN